MIDSQSSVPDFEMNDSVAIEAGEPGIATYSTIVAQAQLERRYGKFDSRGAIGRRVQSELRKFRVRAGDVLCSWSREEAEHWIELAVYHWQVEIYQSIARLHWCHYLSSSLPLFWG